ncbi:MAG: hypothetical protein P8Y24_11640, partial [Gammaproteobacteria bacterium]
WADPYRFGNNNQCPDAFPWNIRLLYRTENEQIRSLLEIKNFYLLHEKLSYLEGIEIYDSGYALGDIKPVQMYIDIGIKNMHSKNFNEKANLIRQLAKTIYNFAIEIGISKSVTLEAMCLYCTDHNSPEYKNLLIEVQNISK